MTQMRLPAVAPIDLGPAHQADPGISSIPADLSRRPRDMKKAGPEARSTGGLAGPYFGTPAGAVARGRIQCLWRGTKRRPRAFWPQVLAPRKGYFRGITWPGWTGSGKSRSSIQPSWWRFSSGWWPLSSSRPRC